MAGAARATGVAWILVLGLPAQVAASPEAGGTRIVAPRANRPATHRPGDVLAIDVRLTSALTPPPGVQQPRALAGWGAWLDGDGVPLAAGLAHRYPVSVTRVRPAGDRSLVYRAFARVPAWAAPGIYAIAVETPTGGARADAAVRVIDGAGPRAIPRRRVVVPLGGAVAAEGPVRWFPAAPFDDPRVEPALVAETRSTHPRPALVARALPVGALEVVASPPTPVVLSPLTWSTDAPAGAVVFWSDGLGGTGVGRRWRGEARVPGPLSVEALAVTPDGRAFRGGAGVDVLRRTGGCRANGSLPGGPTWAILAAVAAAWNRHRVCGRSTIR